MILDGNLDVAFVGLVFSMTHPFCPFGVNIFLCAFVLFASSFILYYESMFLNILYKLEKREENE